MAYVPIHQFTEGDSVDLYKLISLYRGQEIVTWGDVWRVVPGRDAYWCRQAIEHLRDRGLI